MKKWQNDENCRRHHGCCRRCIVSPAAKPSMQLLSRRLWLHPCRFSSRKVTNRRPRANFWGRMKKRIPRTPHSGTFNDGEGVKTICQPFYLLNTATTVLFLFQRGKVEVKLAGLSLSQGGLMKNLEGVTRISSKNDS
jgi:hypothetical protein